MPDNSLIAVGRWHLPLDEASALGLRRTNGGLELLSADDDRYRLSRASLTEPLVTGPPTDISGAFHVDRKAEGSNFEGVAADGHGRVFLLRENNSEVAVLAPDLAHLERTIELRDGAGRLGSDWGEPNSRGEGLLLLRNGHLLIAQQRKPRLIEFGPVGAQAQGYRTGLAVGPDDPFPLPDVPATFDALAVWPIPGAARLRSLNDLAVDGSGRLWVVSSASARLARLRGTLEPGGAPPTFDRWRLPVDVVPDSESKAEGLVLWPGRGWLVAIDLDGAGAADAPNVFLLEGP